MRLAERLREATRAEHARAEHSGVMRQLLRGKLPRPRYAAMLANLQAIYAALEPALERHADHPALAPIHDPRLWRRAALQADLATFAARGDAAIEPLAEARAYATRIERLACEAPALLAAHAYTRYLGDLAGGQVLARVVARSYALDGDAGLAFYRFAEPGAAALAQRFRAGLEQLAVDEATTTAIIDEARSAFERHVRLFDALACG